MRIFGNSESGNCLKPRWIADYLDLDYEWVEIDIFAGQTRTEEFLTINPAGQVPVLQVEDRTLAQSNAIMLYIARDSALIPQDRFDRAKMMEWLFWEQYSHEPYVAVRRTQMKYFGKTEAELDPDLLAKGRRALGVMEMRLLARDWFAGESMSLADISLVAYTRVAHEGGFDLDEFPSVAGWVRRTESELGLEHALHEPL